MPDRYDIRPDETGWTVCDRGGVGSIRDARPIRSGLRVEDADEIAYEMSHDPDPASNPHLRAGGLYRPDGAATT